MDDIDDKDNLQMYRYLDHEMTREERSLFEEKLQTNEALREAVELEQLFLQLGQTAGKKIKQHYDYDDDEKKSGDDEEVIAIIKRARENWEKNDTGALERNDTMPHTISTKGDALEENFDKVRRIIIRKWLAVAAVIAGVAICCIWLWNYDKKNNPGIIVQNGKTDSTNNNKNPDTSYPQKNAPNNIAKEDKKKPIEIKKKDPRALSQAEANALFAQNFKLDTIPWSKPDTLQQAFAYFKSGEYKDAITAFNDVIMYVEERGFEGHDKELTEFYAHYYLALSYMCDGNTVEAIPEFESAIAKSPDNLWKSKAQWYLALEYLKTGNTIKSKKLLKQLAGKTESVEYKQRAINLVSVLEKR